MSLPLHLLSDVPLTDHPSTVHDRLVGDAEEAATAATAATADALAWMAWPASRWGTTPSELRAGSRGTDPRPVPDRTSS